MGGEALAKGSVLNSGEPSRAPPSVFQTRRELSSPLRGGGTPIPTNVYRLLHSGHCGHSHGDNLVLPGVLS